MFKVTFENGKAAISTPYNPEFVSKIKNAGGKWNREGKTWDVPEENIEYAREIMMDVYGRTDVVQGDCANVKLTFKYEMGEFNAPLVIMGKTVSVAYGRDSGAKSGDDVVFLKGKPISSGSVKNWKSSVEQGSIVILKNVPTTKVKSFDEDEDIIVEIEEDDDTSRLLKEKEAIESRLEEINKILENKKGNRSPLKS
ncbi:hypothetical protein [Eubacterium sp.]|uniref:hypothetical protein n=1 Tax=Eubacterium sp. TaxID=142586 RepID=UPI002FC769E3